MVSQWDRGRTCVAVFFKLQQVNSKNSGRSTYHDAREAGSREKISKNIIPTIRKKGNGALICPYFGLSLFPCQEEI